MGYIAYIYCQHKKQQKETEDRAQLLLQQAQQQAQQSYHFQQTYQNQQSVVDLQQAQTYRPSQSQSQTQLFNPPSFVLDGIQEEHENDVVEEEDEIQHHNERTPLIKQLPAFNRMNL